MSRDNDSTTRTSYISTIMLIVFGVCAQGLFAEEQENVHPANLIESEVTSRSILVQTSYEEVEVAEPPLPWAAAEPIQSPSPSKYEISWAFRESKQPTTGDKQHSELSKAKTNEPRELDLAKLINQNSRPIDETEVSADDERLNESSFPATKTLTAKQLELVASEADTSHKLNRVIKHAELSLLKLSHNEADLKKIHSIAAWALLTRGQLRQANGHSIEALQDYTEALSYNPNSFAARQCRGILLAKINQTQEALIDFDRAIELDSDSLSMRYNRASLLLSMGEVEKSYADADYALMLYEKRKQISPRLLTSLYELHGTASHLLGKETEAYQSYSEALKHSDSKGHLLLKRGSLLASERIYKQAIDDLLASIEEGSHAAQAYRRLSWLLATCEDPRFRNIDKAIEAVMRARKLSASMDSELEEITAKVYAAAGEYQKAAQHQQQAILLAKDAEARETYQVQLSAYQEADQGAGPSNKKLRRAAHPQTPTISQ